MSTSVQAQQRAAVETTKVLHEISTLLNTGLDREALSVCISMCENNANPEALAAVIKELRRESQAVKGVDSAGAPSSSSLA